MIRENSEPATTTPFADKGTQRNRRHSNDLLAHYASPGAEKLAAWSENLGQDGR
jgi:hypothetical protein